MPPLPPELRRDLEHAVIEARSLAEVGARAALARLGAEERDAPAALTKEQRDLRTALRERAKALGGGLRMDGFPLLVEEIAYEQWHRMLFARFLAENQLLLHPEGAPVSLTEVKDLAEEEGERDHWVLAARYAAAMLPGIFRADDPANRVVFAPEDRSRLESVLEALPAPLFTADDALGWVYQFWQSQTQTGINAAGDKISGSDLGPVTQYFTEDYMVRFLLENSLGAWWAGRHPDSPLLQEWEYLRFRDDGTPAAGTFEGWPSRVAEVTVLDPCCGSGHFLIAAADMLRKMRIEEERLTPNQAAAAVIADNLFGLELDARCLQLAAFNLALDAWKAGGYQPLPLPNLACSGIAIKGQRDDWHRLAGDDDRMRAALDRLYNLFIDAPDLGSLIDPRSAAGEGLWAVDPGELLDKLEQALARETVSDPAAAVFGAAAAGTARAARLLSGRYWLVATNVPYLGSRDIGAVLSAFLKTNGDLRDLAVAMLGRCRASLQPAGYLASVSPQAWLMTRAYKPFRSDVVESSRIRLVVRIGPGGFSGIAGEIVNPALVVTQAGPPRGDAKVVVIDITSQPGAEQKSRALEGEPATTAPLRASAFVNDGIGAMLTSAGEGPLSRHAHAYQGSTSGDNPRWLRYFWEVGIAPGWRAFQGSVEDTLPYAGRSHVIRWARDGEQLKSSPQARIQGFPALGKLGVTVRQMGHLPATLYTGDLFDMNVAAIVPDDAGLLLPLWSYLASDDYPRAVRLLDQSLKVTNATLVKVPFDLEHWQQVAAERYPDGLPDPHSDDPRQWLFRGVVLRSEAPLQVAVARLLGYRWPDQESDALDELADADGLVPVPAVGGERSAADRLRDLLVHAYGEAWSPQLLERLLAEAGSPGKSLEEWLQAEFFPQHSRLFENRPFIWHVWDGRKDGFSVLCHYHRLDRAKLQKLTYTLLGDWIERQRAGGDEPGAEARLNAALALQDKLRLILEGEAPYDIYVRWKSLAEQPLGWEPDLDDGVRLNIRPFVTAGILRVKVNVKWDKDRGKDPDGSERINDRHLTLAEKRAARAAVGRG